MAEASSRKVVVAALAANTLVAVTKFLAAGVTGSSAMLSEAVHSLVDTGNEALLLYGQHRAARPPDALHPLGYGPELYFWSFVVALSIFAVGSGVSVYEGILHMLHPEPISYPYANYAVLGAAFLFDGYSWIVAFRAFRQTKGSLGWLEAVERSKDPPGFIVLFEDSADLLGLALAFAGNVASTMLHMPVLDGAASVGIGLVLAGVAAILARESKGLLLGEAADPDTAAAILEMARQANGVTGVNELFTIQLGPEQVVAALNLDFDDTLTAADVESVVATLERRIQALHPDVGTILIKPQSRRDFDGRQRRP